jgi:hypothetical protein
MTELSCKNTFRGSPRNCAIMTTLDRMQFASVWQMKTPSRTFRPAHGNYPQGWLEFSA